MKENNAIRVILLFSYLVVAIGGKHLKCTNSRGSTSQIRRIQQANRTIQAEDGDVYDCVDVNLQPTFKHPLLKDHKIQMEPSSFPTRLDIKSSLAPAVSQAQLSLIDCPIGTVPILRHNKVDNMMTRRIRRIVTHTPNDDHQQELAGIQYWDDEIYGTSAAINVYKPTVNEDSKDLSASWIQLNNGPNVGDVTIGAGSWVAPGFSGDSFARFHILWVNEALNNTCTDHTCPGFVQVSHHVGLGGRFIPSLCTMDHNTDPKTTNWWLAYGDHNTMIGYWPSSQFSYLKAKAVFAYWGGYVLGPTASSDPPQMGSGHFASEGFGKAAFIRDIQIIDKNNMLVNPDVCKAHPGTSDPTRFSYDRDGVDEDGMHVYYGGPGNY